MKDEEEQEETEEAEEQEQVKDIKLGEIEVKPNSFLVIKKTNYKGEDRIDFRIWLNSAKYKGPTKQGFVLAMDKIDDFVKIVEGMKKKLEQK